MDGGNGTPALREMELGELLSAALQLYRQHWVTFAAITAVIIVPWEIVYFSATQNAEQYAGWPAAMQVIESFAIMPLIAGALAKAIADAFVGVEPTTGSTFAHVAPRLGTLIGVGILTTAAVLLGFLLLIVPGIIIGTRLFAGTTVATLEGTGVTDSMRRSWDLVTGRTGQVLLALIVAGLLAAMVAVAIVLPFAASDSTATIVTGQVIAALVTAPFTAAVSVLLYLDLRVRSEGLDRDLLERQLRGAPGLG